MACSKLSFALEKLAPVSKVDTAIPQLPPIFFEDVQDLILFALEGHSSEHKPRWCTLRQPSDVNKIVVIVLNGLDTGGFQRYSHPLPVLTTEFALRVEMVSPSQYGSSALNDLFTVTRSTEYNQATATHASPVKKKMRQMLVPRDLILTPRQQQTEPYPMPVIFPRGANPYEGYVFTKDTYSEVTDESPLFAIDCEMCITSAGRKELTSIAVINEGGEVIYKTLVRPRNVIRDYLTQFSGITAQMMASVNTRLEDVQAAIRKLLPPDAIICGHSFYHDLNAMKMFHPFVIDTSHIYNLSGLRNKKAGLKKLAALFLHKAIQQSYQGHSTVEDARCSLDLVKLKLEQGYDFGDAVLRGSLYTPYTRLRPMALGSSSEPANSSPLVPSSLKESKIDKKASGDSERSPRVALPPKLNRMRACLLGPRAKDKLSFVKLVHKFDNKVALVGSCDDMKRLEDEGATFVRAESDEDCVKSVKTALQTHDIIYTELNACCQTDSQPQSQASIKKLNEQVGDLLKATPPNALVIVLLPGNTTDADSKNALCLTKLSF